MDKDQAQAALKAIKDLTEFSKKSRVPLRTLARIKAGRCSPHKTTLALLESDLKRIKPETSGEKL